MCVFVSFFPIYTVNPVYSVIMKNDVIGEPVHVPISTNFTPQSLKSQQIKENAKE